MSEAKPASRATLASVAATDAAAAPAAADATDATATAPGEDAAPRDKAAPGEDAEATRVRERYAKRPGGDPRYDLTNPATLAAWQERQRAMLCLLDDVGLGPLPALLVLEVGSGAGDNLLELLRLGFRPEHLSGIELLAERHEAARARLPSAVRLTCADATRVTIADASVDVVLQSTVFSSLLDDEYQAKLAATMWRAARPGGGVLWYDFTVNNPRNRDVRGVPLARLRRLFPQARISSRRVTLAPPLARAVANIHPSLYGVFNALPLLRTHVIAWAAKEH